MNILEALDAFIQQTNSPLHRKMRQSLDKWSKVFAAHNKESLELILRFFITGITYKSKTKGMQSVVCTSNNGLIHNFNSSLNLVQPRDKNVVCTFNVVTKKVEFIDLDDWSYDGFFIEFSPNIEYSDEDKAQILETLNALIKQKTVKF